uniref:hypothetical protein n=1 Tax=Parerythrobacter lutipelagi TaxID=1964208 RepID=UPI001F015D55|nr:hypothetical protein [Parerythrobacter lutipelagi]
MALSAALVPLQSQAQTQPAGVPQVQPPPSMRPTPSQLELSKMIWSTISAVDHANRSGNYSVLRDISAQSFQIQNNASRLSEIFAGIRNSRIDLSNALLVPPTYNQAPQMIREDIFRVQGFFQIRPIALSFDLYYQWEQGMWKLVGIDLQPVEMSTGAPQR